MNQKNAYFSRSLSRFIAVFAAATVSGVLTGLSIRIKEKSLGNATSFPTLANADKRFWFPTLSLRGELERTPKTRNGFCDMIWIATVCKIAHRSRKAEKDWLKEKAQDPYCYSSRYQGMWLRRFIVERATQSLRRMIYDTPIESCHKRYNRYRVCYHTRDIYCYSSPDDG